MLPPVSTTAANLIWHTHGQPLSAEDIHPALEHAGDLAGLLAEAERETRARFYRTLDLVLNLGRPSDPGRTAAAL